MGDELAPAKHAAELQPRPFSDSVCAADITPTSSLPSSSSSFSAGPPWYPRQLGFCSYSPNAEAAAIKSPALRVVVRKPLLARLTKDIVETYKICNPKFKFCEELNPKHYLTSPSIGVLNEGYDNANSDLILSVNCDLVNLDTQQSYVVKDLLGHGTFGQVAKCWFAEGNSFVAVKVIKNQPAYYQQALVEVSILRTLNKKYDPEDRHHIVRIYDYFVHQRHLCIVFELLDTNLYELIKMNSFRGLSLSIVQSFSKQILRGLILMKDAGIIHCDLKPENILLCTSVKPPEVKIIDFGSACMEDRTVYSYIQSRYYRSPEVVLGYQYTTAIDMWSFGCIVAELFLGLPLFPGASEFDLLRRMIEILGGQPPDHILKGAKNASKYFKCIGSVHYVENGGVSMGRRSAFSVLTEEEYETRELKKPAIGKQYFKQKNLEAIVTSYPYGKNLPEDDIAKERTVRQALIDFLRGLVEFDPAKRWSPFQASKHPFVTGEPFTCPYEPLPETPRMPVSQNVKIDHHPGGGHWFAAGLSPNIPGMNRAVRQSSPHFQMVPPAHASSYGSLGSHGSYTDGAGLLGNSYGSYGDNYNNNNMFAYFSPVGPSGFNLHAQGGMSMLGTSPDARRRFIQHPHVNGLGFSPSAGNFASLPLGTSPSQFTPPNSYNQLSAGSPGHYGPTSPARGSCHGSPLGKMAPSSQFSRRKSMGYSGSLQSQESASPMQRLGPFNDSSLIEGSPQGLGSSAFHLQTNYNAASWKQQRGGIGISPGCTTTQTQPGSSLRASNMQVPHVKDFTNDKPEACHLPDPGDWDPNYSDDLLLEEGVSEANCLTAEFSRAMIVNQDLVSPESIKGVGKLNHARTTNASIPIQRTNGLVHASNVEVSNPPSFHDQRAGYGRSVSKPSHFTSHSPQNSPSRLGQQSIPRYTPGRSSAVHGSEWNQIKGQSPSSTYFSGGTNTPGNSSLNSGVALGGRANHQGAKLPPTSHGRRDYGRIG